jgi:hypothetical protein
LSLVDAGDYGPSVFLSAVDQLKIPAFEKGKLAAAAMVNLRMERFVYVAVER